MGVAVCSRERGEGDVVAGGHVDLQAENLDPGKAHGRSERGVPDPFQPFPSPRAVARWESWNTNYKAEVVTVHDNTNFCTWHLWLSRTVLHVSSQ